jgi:hypothetical protein
MTNDVLPNSRRKKYEDQEKLITRIGNSYEVPEILKAAVCVSAKYFKFGEHTFNKDTNIRCQEQTKGFQLTIGSFKNAGPEIWHASHAGSSTVGIGAMKKLDS